VCVGVRVCLILVCVCYFVVDCFPRRILRRQNLRKWNARLKFSSLLLCVCVRVHVCGFCVCLLCKWEKNLPTTIKRATLLFVADTAAVWQMQTQVYHTQCVCVYITCMCTYTRTYKCIYIYLYIYAHTHTCIYVCLYVHMQVCIYT